MPFSRVSSALALLGLGWVVAIGCGPASQLVPPPPQPTDSGQPATDSGLPATDSGTDSGTVWADAGRDAGTDAGTTGRDGGTDAGRDGGTDAGTDAGNLFGGVGPWPTTNVTYGSAQGIQEQPVVGMSTDETQNIWVATQQALYLMRPGQSTFHRFDAAAGLHLQSNPVAYCDDFGSPACPTLTYGAAADPGISEIVGGGPNEVFVGYWGHDDGPADFTDVNRHSGKLDRVRLNPNGTLSVERFDMVSSTTVEFWHNRSVQRMIYDHFLHPHELYVGTNHGVDYMRPDNFRHPDAGEWFNDVNNLYMSDHLHPRVCYHAACPGESEENQLMGDWKGLALTANGDLWVAGRWTGGLITRTEKLKDWESRGGGGYKVAFGDPYRNDAGQVLFPPIFLVPLEGDAISASAAAVTADGRAWFASGPTYDFTNSPAYGVASYAPGVGFTYYDPMRDMGMAEENVRDMVVLPNGRMVLAGPNTGLVIWNPATGAHATMSGSQWLPSDLVNRLDLDTMVNPPALHVSTWGGATTLRQLPTP